MKTFKFLSVLLFIVSSILFGGCIHEYPYSTDKPGKGEIPGSIDCIIEAEVSLNWENILHEIDFSTRQRTDNPHRIAIEISYQGTPVVRDIVFLSEAEFSLGRLNHKLSKTLEAKVYDIALWHDMEDSDGLFPFNISNLDGVILESFSTTETSLSECAFASEKLDLTDYIGQKERITVTKELSMKSPGFRFELIANDIQKFISLHKEELNQGDKFYTHVTFFSGGTRYFNIYTSSGFGTINEMKLSGRMRLPFEEYTSLKIAEGFLFTLKEDFDEAEVQLSISNSALVTVSCTDPFKFPIKRGHVTTITGNFLTHPIDGNFSIDTVWDGEIIQEIED